MSIREATRTLASRPSPARIEVLVGSNDKGERTATVRRVHGFHVAGDGNVVLGPDTQTIYDLIDDLNKAAAYLNGADL